MRKPVKGGGYELLKEPYIESTIEDILDCNSIYVSAVITNNIERYCDAAVEIEYLDGYDRSSMSALDADDCSICVLNGGFMEKNGIELGDTVGITVLSIQFNILLRIAGSEDTINYFRGNISDDNEQFKAKIAVADRLIEESTARCKVVGRLTCEGERSEKISVFFPVGRELDAIHNWIFSEEYNADPSGRAHYFDSLRAASVFEHVEYTIASRDHVDAFSKYVKRIILESVGATRFSPLLIDTGEADSMTRTMELLDGLYPIAVAAAAILGGLFPGLIVMQSDREASIMRVLGTSKKRVRPMLVLEQSALYLLGLLCAAALLLCINGASLAGYPAPLLLYALLHLATCAAGALICSVIITRRSPLALLQVKE